MGTASRQSSTLRSSSPRKHTGSISQNNLEMFRTQRNNMASSRHGPSQTSGTQLTGPMPAPLLSPPTATGYPHIKWQGTWSWKNHGTTRHCPPQGYKKDRHTHTHCSWETCNDMLKTSIIAVAAITSESEACPRPLILSTWRQQLLTFSMAC